LGDWLTLQTIQGAPDRASCQFTPNLVAAEGKMVRAMDRGRRGGRGGLANGAGPLPGGQQPIVVERSPVIDPHTRAELQAEVRPARRHPYMAVAGLALTGKHVGLVLACGHGTVFIPGAKVALADRGVVPDASFRVSF
jgi:hypothetical protein